MTGSGDPHPRDRGAAGGPARHVPVLRAEVIDALRAAGDGSVGDGLFLDATFGAGGYSAALLAQAGTRVLALDRDPAAIRGGSALVDASAGRLALVEARFSDMETVAGRLGLGPFDGITLDVGVSSMQLDEAERGFSFRRDGPLDMRMGGSGPSAADLVNGASAEALADILYHYGEERHARRVARAIVADRAAVPFRTTLALAGLVARVVPHKPTEIHPATRTFQALRIAVNDELGELVAALAAAERLLAPGGRLAVVTFHSLEDRIVKQFLARRAGRGEAAGRRLPGEPAATAPSFALPKGQPVVPGAAEAADNPRARSAKLRVGLRTHAPAVPLDPALRSLALLPEPARPQQARPQQAKAGHGKSGAVRPSTGRTGRHT